jgi:hypothetical protein
LICVDLPTPSPPSIDKKRPRAVMLPPLAASH